MRSDDEILDDLAKILQEGERNGSIHFNPPGENCLKDWLPDERLADAEPNAPAIATENPKNESQQDQPLTKEQLRGLLIDFLDRLVASKPPARESEDT